MQTIPQTFFITGLGRSGTKFLASVLNRSQNYSVVHEWDLPLPGFRDRWLGERGGGRFPIHRFWLARHPFPGARRGYGEVNSFLRFTLGRDAGSERFVERRAVIVRDPRDIIASIMNRGNRTAEDFEPVCEELLKSYARVEALSRHPNLEYERFEFERMTSEVDYLQSIVRWAGIDDVTVTERDLGGKVNVNKSHWFPRYSDWDNDHRLVYQSIASRLGIAG